MIKHGTSYPPYTTPSRIGSSGGYKRPWNFDTSCVLALMPEQGTKWIDYSRYGNHGTLTGNATFQARGQKGDAVYFDGTGDYVNCGDDASLNIVTQYTVAMWIKFVNITDNQTFFNKAIGGNTPRDMCLAIRPTNNEIRCGYDSGGTNKGAALSTSGLKAMTWTHIAFVRGITTDYFQLYVNAKALTMIDATGYYTPTGDVVSVGGRTTTALMKGWIEQVLMFNRMLSPGEIRDLYQQGV